QLEDDTQEFWDGEFPVDQSQQQYGPRRQTNGDARAQDERQDDRQSERQSGRQDRRQDGRSQEQRQGDDYRSAKPARRQEEDTREEPPRRFDHKENNFEAKNNSTEDRAADTAAEFDDTSFEDEIVDVPNAAVARTTQAKRAAARSTYERR